MNLLKYRFGKPLSGCDEGKEEEGVGSEGFIPLLPATPMQSVSADFDIINSFCVAQATNIDFDSGVIQTASAI
jgi:hypothetical protein